MFQQLKLAISNFRNNEEGLTATEYAVCAALVSAALIGAFALLGNNITTVITTLANTIAG